MESANHAISSRSGSHPRAFSTILWIGLIAGTLDISENLIFNQLRGITPQMVFQYIASGLIGMKSFGAGSASVALGVVLHYCIALIWTAIFYAGSRKLAFLSAAPSFASFFTAAWYTCS